MGEKDVHQATDQEQLRRFTQHLLRDVRALEAVLASDLIETGVRRIGLEQEMFLVDRAWRPAPVAPELLERIQDPRIASEIGRFNLEGNLAPVEFGGDCLSCLQGRLDDLLANIRDVAGQLQISVVLTGILPTLRKSDLTLDNMMPEPRYFALNEALSRLRGGPYDFKIKGTDELRVTHESVMVESCNASFQVHFQVSPAEFARLYNIALAVTGPVMAAAVNSPLLFGRRLWHETRIALFQQSVDTRSASPDQRDITPRVSFGRSWVQDSVLDIVREDIARFKVILGREIEEDSLTEVRRGRAPRLQALQLHNSTVYRWNRPCYGVSNGLAHLRIENRVLPAGPTTLDEMANAAFWFGLVSGLADEHGDIRKVIEFDDVHGNFFAAATHGLGARLTWFDGKTHAAEELLADELLPLARRGLDAAGIAGSDIERYLDVVEARVRSGQTGAQWMLKSLAAMKDAGTTEERMSALTGAVAARQKNKTPVHEWKLANLSEGGCWKPNFLRVEQYMKTDLTTVHEDEPIELVAHLMDWNRIRHIPVEDHAHRLVGLVSYRSVMRFLAQNDAPQANDPTPVREIMKTDPITVPPATSTLDAIALMNRHWIGALPVTKEGRLVGLVTERDFLRIAGQLMVNQLRE